MAEPATGGLLKTRIEDMQVGDYIKCVFSASWGYGFLSLGEDNSLPEIPYTGLIGTNQVDNAGYFYLIKVDKGLLISDRIVMNRCSWDDLNKIDYIQEKMFRDAFKDDTHNSLSNGIIRSLGGGNSYADANGKSSTGTDFNLGAWPVDNEWDTHIAKKDYGTGVGRDDIWHWNGAGTICQETPVIASKNSDYRVYRGRFNSVKYFSDALTSSATQTWLGFRPCFQYEEATSW